MRAAFLLGLLGLSGCDTTVLDLGGDASASGGGAPSDVDRSGRQLTTGGNSSCFRRSDGVVKCWGQNDKGQLGVQTEHVCGTLDCSSVPVTVPALEGSRQIALGGRFGCALADADGGTTSLTCWGENTFGQLGRGTSDQDSHFEPLDVDLDGALEVVLGPHHACAILEQKVFCWGLGEDGQLGVDPATLSRCPVPQELRGVAGVPDADDAACAREPFEVPAFAGAAYLALGDAHTCASFQGNQLVCAGRNDAGQLGIGAGFEGGFEPQEVFPRYSHVIAAGGEHTCAARGTDTFCWGSDTHGQVGVGSVEHQDCAAQPCLLTPTPVPDLPPVLYHQLGSRFSCALLLDGTARCWGDDSSGQVGNSSFDQDTCETSSDGSVDCLKRPLQEVYGISGVVELRAGSKHACALLEDGEVRCWGNAEAGQTSGHESFTFPMLVYGLN